MVSPGRNTPPAKAIGNRCPGQLLETGGDPRRTAGRDRERKSVDAPGPRPERLSKGRFSVVFEPYAGQYSLGAKESGGSHVVGTQSWRAGSIAGDRTYPGPQLL